ncbi:hypothetical protein [Actinomadura terrae]|uniref:hypothetical protein n=1 Tax=Actinomadura terrae TaxID=604353 RepID=UPI001FA6BA1F|nr:hypothetical protein [Actinomadura terrae]
MPFWKAGDRLTASRLAFTDITEWQDYVPIWTGSTTNPAIGSGILTGRYVQVGGTCFFRAYMKAAADTTFGSGAWALYPPFNPSNDPPGSVSGWIQDASVTKRYPVTGLLAGTFIRILADPAGALGISSSTPFTWAVNDELCIGGCIEID